MKTLKLLCFLIMLLALTPSAFAQSATTFTTLTVAVSGGSANNRITVNSVTGISASTTSTSVFTNSGGAFYCLIDHELVLVSAVDTTNKILTIRRGIGGSAAGHPNGQVILCGVGGTFNPNTGNTSGVFLGTAVPHGSCTPGNNQFLPVVSASPPAGTWDIYNCTGGTPGNGAFWANQTLPNETPARNTRYCAPDYLGVLTLLRTFGQATAPFDVGNDTTPVAGTWLYGTINIPQTTIVKGVSVLNGTVAGTDTLIYSIWSGAGPKLGNTTTAGTTAAGTLTTFQDIDLTGQILLTGPARYWVGWQASGTTTRVRTVQLTPGASTAGLGAFIGMLGSSILGTTGTVPGDISSFAVKSGPVVTDIRPTSLIANTAPVACVYTP